ncbi:MAG: PIN domain-containing protein [Archaeoglobaceae archaeon]
MVFSVYLDTCTWCRPFDDQTQIRIRDETAAFYEVLLHIDREYIEVVGSDALLAEIEDISNKSKRERVKMLIKRGASLSVRLDENVKKIASAVERECGLHGGDALQLASAKMGEVKYFITTDGGILGSAKCISKEQA